MSDKQQSLREILENIDAKISHIEDISADNRSIIVKLVKQGNQIVTFLKTLELEILEDVETESIEMPNLPDLPVSGKKISNPKYFIFSDDMEWCENNLKFGQNHTFVSHDYKGLKFGEYLVLMSACKNFIIPNSTFAWWAAWLNDNKEKIVITPKKWFKNDKMITAGLRPESWINLE